MKVMGNESLIDGKIYWMTSTYINNSFKVERIGRPKKVIFHRVPKSEEDKQLRPWNSSLYEIFLTEFATGKSITYFYGVEIFDTEEEAIEEFNKRILVNLDMLESFYENRKNILQNLIIEKKS